MFPRNRTTDVGYVVVFDHHNPRLCWLATRPGMHVAVFATRQAAMDFRDGCASVVGRGPGRVVKVRYTIEPFSHDDRP